ncbi:U1 small nuclear ribonucleoprotein C [Striga hermonthica]|uniref:U1 small nuclear ribonucleoprotein C n=1 Tax=Striga hermonthica TaxID=68872 RepID=A0A9N7NHM5_STRHE|nr:U1 small nuclear ribonucleoprotein C [Striga hermonthica]
MPRYYCDYCDTYLTHDSPSVRKQHNSGYKHKANIRAYYQKFEEQQTQLLLEQRIKEHQQIGAAYNQHLAAFPGGPPRQPVMLPLHTLPFPGGAPIVPGMRPLHGMPMPIPGTPGYASAPVLPPMQPLQPSGPPASGPQNTSAPPQISGAGPPPNSSGAPPNPTQMYSVNPTGTTITATAPPTTGGYSYQQASQTSH